MNDNNGEEAHLIELFQCTKEQYDNRDKLVKKILVSPEADSDKDSNQ